MNRLESPFEVLARFWILPLVVIILWVLGCSRRESEAGQLKSLIDFSQPGAAKTAGVFGVYDDAWVAPEASITLTNLDHHRTLILEGTNVGIGKGGEELRIAIVFGAETLHVARITALGEFREPIALPTRTAASDTVELSLVSYKSFVPSQLGTSKDDRVLSFRIRKIGFVPPEQTKEALPTSFEFPRSSVRDPNLQGIYSDGWIADSGVVTLFNLENKKEVEIRGSYPLNIFPRLADLEVFAANRLLLKHQMRRQDAGYFRIRAQLPEGQLMSSKLVLTLKPSGSFVPAELKINDDRRRISFRLEYIGFR